MVLNICKENKTTILINEGRHMDSKEDKVSTLHLNWKILMIVNCDKSCIYNVIPRATL